MTGAEINLMDQSAAMALIHQRRDDLGLTLAEMERASGVPIGTYQHWRRNTRTPRWSKFVALVEAVGLTIIMRGNGREVRSGQLVDLMAAIEAENKARGASLLHLEIDSGLAMNTLYAWRSGRRDAAMFLLAVAAETCGFKLLLMPAS